MKRTLLLSALAIFSLVPAANAAVVLIVDVTNPSAVKITATSALSSGSSSLRMGYDGLTLLNILPSTTSNIPNTSVVSSDVATSNLVPTQSPVTSGGIVMRYTGVGSFNHDAATGTLEPGNDLGVYQNGADGLPNSQVFNTGVQAFKGESVWNLSAFAASLPRAGTTGNVLSGYLPFTTGSQQGIVLGQYVVIPEPSAAALGGLAAASLLLRRRRY